MKTRRTTVAGALTLCAIFPTLAAAQDLPAFVPPPCVPGQEMFTDVPASDPFCPWIEQIFRDHITGGCGPQLYCPAAPLTRAQMSVFLELAMRGTDTWIVDADLLDGMDSTDFVTGVGAGTGLTGGGSGGSVTLGLEPTYQLPQSCAGGQHPEWTGSGWTCGSPGTGTVMSVGTGAGLTGGPITTSGTIGVAPGGITSAMIADGTVGSADVADGSIGAADVAPAQVQLRVAAPCPPGEFIRVVNADGTVVCAADGNSGGTVTSVATGAGLTGGPITGAGTLSVAPGGITGAMIADGTIGAADVASAQVQLRVSQGCLSTGFMRAVNPDGTVSCGAQSGHDHFGQVWQGGTAGSGLLVYNSQGPGVFGGSDSTSGTGVRGQVDALTGTTYGVVGATLSTSGTGVGGFSSASTGATSGVFGTSQSTSGAGVRGSVFATTGETVGVFGFSNSTSGTGVHGEATFAVGGTDPTYGVLGLNHRDFGAGVRGEGPTAGVQGTATNTSFTATGVHGTSSSASSSARGVLGEATATFGQTNGVAGVSASTQGRGVQGTATATTGQVYGVHGTTVSTQGVGVGGYATATSGTNYGVIGSTSSASGYAGFFSGRVHMTSNLFVLGDFAVGGTKNFKIDHPLDPANRYLVHAAIESSEMLNMYSGTAVLDAAGTANIELPEWFEALNRDFRYQLTCIGGYAPVYIASEIEDGRFGIAGGRAGLKVSWQVVGTRSDAHAIAHPMAVEEEKPAEERGTYLDPEAHGQPVERGRDYEATSTFGRE